MGILVSSVSENRKFLIWVILSFLFVGCVFFILHFYSSSESLVFSSYTLFNGGSQQSCEDLESLDDYEAKCLYLKSNGPCVSQGYIDYLYLFYCNFSSFPLLGYLILIIWLLVLFYLLGNTASEYFCATLESLTRLLKLSPTIAGVTLLSLGNGAPDVFASIVSFTGTGTQDVGLSTVLGGASFVICVVVGIISISVHNKHIRVHRSAFVRDICFFLLVVIFLAVILVSGEISIWGAMGFASMYIVYVLLVYIWHILSEKTGQINESNEHSSSDNDLTIPILNGMEKEELISEEEGPLEDGAGVDNNKGCSCLRRSASCCLCILGMPLHLVRRLTVPVVCEDRWSKPYAVTSVTLAPLLLSLLWNTQDDNMTFTTSLIVYGLGLLFGITFGVLAFMTTKISNPPRKCLLPWLAGGFVMSVTWSYITAQELVGMLVSLGYILGISPSILALTVLAWGDSLGDLMTNMTMALKGGSEGTQVAISGSYAGPIFNILFGLGLSLVGLCWYDYPSAVVLPADPYLLETCAFLAGGLLWALVIMLWRDMRLDGVLGAGLLAIYLISLFVRLI